MEVTGTTNSDKDRDMMIRKSFESGTETSTEKKKKKKSLSFEPKEPPKSKENQEAKAPKQEAGPEKPFSFKFLGREVEAVTEKPKAKDLAETAESAPENMTEEETKVAVEKITEARENELDIELAGSEEGSLTEAAVRENIEFIKALREHSKDESADAAIDAAFAEIMGKEEDMLDKNADKAGEESLLAADTGMAEVATQANEEEVVEDPTKITATPTSTTGSQVPPPVIQLVPPVYSSPGARGAGGSSGGGPPSYVSPGGMPFGGAGSAPNVLASTPNIAVPKPEAEYIRRGSRSGDLLVGGLIGYMVGRRGGRIRTEERLMPIQHNLEKQVRGLQENIASKENKIREFAANKFVSAQENQTERSRGFLESKSTDTLPPVRQPEVTNETAAGFKIPTPEAPRPEVLKPVDQMTVPELLKVAEHIEINGITAKEMFESRRLDAVNLRRVVGEYMRGSNYERTLKDQLKAEEGRRERSVESRPGQAPGIANNSVGGGSTADSGMPMGWGSRQASQPSSVPTAGHLNTQQPAYQPKDATNNGLAKPAPWLIAAIGLGLVVATLLIYLI